MARSSPSCAHDDDRLRLPAASPSRSNSAEKKEPTDPRLSQLCSPYVTPSSSSSLEHHRSDARIVENGFAASSGVSKSAKVVLSPRAPGRRVTDRCTPPLRTSDGRVKGRLGPDLRTASWSAACCGGWRRLTRGGLKARSNRRGREL